MQPKKGLNIHVLNANSVRRGYVGRYPPERMSLASGISVTNL